MCALHMEEGSVLCVLCHEYWQKRSRSIRDQSVHNTTALILMTGALVCILTNLEGRRMLGLHHLWKWEREFSILQGEDYRCVDVVDEKWEVCVALAMIGCISLC